MKISPTRITAFLLLATTAHAASPSATDTQLLYLSGHNKDDALPWSFSCNAGQQANIQTTIPVPSNWELHNFGIFSYGVEHRSSKSKTLPPPPTVTGHYQTHFTPPADFANKRIFLVFEGVMTDTTALINNKPAGPMHQGGYTRFKYEITTLLQPGENSLDVTVQDESANDSVNNAERRADYFNYAGIFRPVYLEAVPQSYIDHLAINATADGNFSLDAFTTNTTPDQSLEAQIYDAQNHPVGQPFATPLNASTTSTSETRPSGSVNRSATSTTPATQSPSPSEISNLQFQIFNLKSQIPNPLLWTAETPNLYTLQLSLKNATQTIHSLRQRFGFRTIDPRPDGLYVNGARVLLKGADRHSFWPDSGRCLSEQISHDDIALMHEMNMNAVRMSHYPPDAHFLDAADEMGLYVLDELPGWHGHYDDTVGHQLVSEMVTRDVNHPSILFWDNGNESGWNTNLDADFPALDPQKRHVLHPWALNDNIDTKHYPDYKTLQQKVDGPNLYFATEMLHGLYDGGAGAGLEDYWNVIMHGKAAAGGFIWAFLDEAPKRVDTDGHLDTRGNLAPDGIVGPYREKEGSFYTIKQLWSPVVITDKTIPADGHFHIENRYNFINLKDCKFSYELRKLHSPDDGQAGYTPVGAGSLVAPNIPPGAAGQLSLPVPLNIDLRSPPDAIAVRIENPVGQEIFTPVFSLHPHDDFAQLTSRKAPDNPPYTADDASDVLKVQCSDMIVEFDKSTGFLKSVNSFGGHFTLSNGPRLVSGEGKLLTLHGDVDKDGVIVTAKYTGDIQQVTWHIHANQWLEITASYHLTTPQPFIGLGFDYPEKNIKSLRYLGAGPFRVYANRTAGPTLSVWQNDYNDSITGSIPWKYPEFKGYFQNVRWAQYQTTEGPLTFLIHDDHTYLQNFTPTEPDKSLVGKTHVPYPATNISFLKLIPPIGSKFSDARNTGPAAQTQPATGDYTTHISIYFGK